jgi:putative ABC transport system ATP-binding protein
MPEAVAQLRGISRIYRKPGTDVEVAALRPLDLDLIKGEYTAIMGSSGSGKSTLMNLLGCLDRPTTGSYLLGDRDVAQLDDDSLSTIRSERIGFVFQNFNLIQQLTVLENLEVPMF